MITHIAPNADHKQHPLSKAFDSMSDAEHAALAADIQKHGLISPITLYQNEVLDGWHRYLACADTGIAPRYVEYAGNDPAAFVQSVNHHRRHSSASRRAMAIVICNQWRTNGNLLLINQEQASKTTAEMARAAGVSLSTISDAKTIFRAGKADEVLKKGKSIASVARPKKPAPAPLPEPTHEDRNSWDEAEQDIIKNNAELEKENNSLRALNDSLSASNSGKEIATWKGKYDAVNGRVRQLLTTETEIKKTCKYYKNLCDKIKTLLGVTKHSEIISTLEGRLK